MLGVSSGVSVPAAAPSAERPAAPATLKIGDKVALLCDSFQAFLRVEGVFDPAFRLLRADNAGDGNFAAECVFTILSSDDFLAEEEAGRVLTYATDIKLQHVTTGRLLTVQPRTRSSVDPACSQISLEAPAAASKASFLRILPAVKFRREGDPVERDDEVLLYSPKANQYLHVSAGQEDTEVNSSYRPAGWRLQLFDGFGSATAAGQLKASDTVMLVHKAVDGALLFDTVWLPAASSNADADGAAAGDAYASGTGGDQAGPWDEVGHNAVDGSDREGDSGEEDSAAGDENSRQAMVAAEKVFVRTRLRGRRPHTNGLWQVQLQHATQGGGVQWSLPVRFKHVATGKYLSVRVVEVPLTAPSSAVDGGVNLAGEAREVADPGCKPLVDLSDPSPAAPRPAEASPRPSATPASERPGTADADHDLLHPAAHTMPLLIDHGRDSAGLSGFPSQAGGMGKETATTLVYELEVSPYADEASLFELHPARRSSESGAVVPSDSYVRVRHRPSGQWLHLRNAFWDGSSDEPRPETALMQVSRRQRKVGLSRVALFQDVFHLRSVQGDILQKVLYLQRVLPTLQQFAQQLAGPRVPRRAECAAATAVLGGLICFCTEADEPNPMRRVGVPQPQHQRLLLDQKVIDIVFSLLRAVRTPRLRDNPLVMDVCNHAYRLVWQMLRGSSAGRRAAAPFLALMVEQLSEGFPAGLSLRELFHDNGELSAAQTSDRVASILEVVRVRGRISAVPAILAHLCRSGEANIARHQRFLYDTLLTHYSDILLFPDPAALPSLVVAPPVPEPGVHSGISVPGWGMTLRTALREHEAPEELAEYFMQLLELYASLALGNVEIAGHLQTRLPLPVLLQWVENENLAVTVRGSLCKVISYVYVDPRPHHHPTRVTFTKVWETVGEHVKHSRRQLPEVAGFIDRFLRSHPTCTADPAVNLMLLRVMQLTWHFVRAGRVRSPAEVRRMVGLLVGYMRRHEFYGVVSSGDRSVWRVTDINEPIVRGLSALCDALQRLLDRRLDVRVDAFLRGFKRSDPAVESPDPHGADPAPTAPTATRDSELTSMDSHELSRHLSMALGHVPAVHRLRARLEGVLAMRVLSGTTGAGTPPLGSSGTPVSALLVPEGRVLSPAAVPAGLSAMASQGHAAVLAVSTAGTGAPAPAPAGTVSGQVAAVAPSGTLAPSLLPADQPHGPVPSRGGMGVSTPPPHTASRPGPPRPAPAAIALADMRGYDLHLHSERASMDMQRTSMQPFLSHMVDERGPTAAALAAAPPRPAGATQPMDVMEFAQVVDDMNAAALGPAVLSKLDEAVRVLDLGEETQRSLVSVLIDVAVHAPAAVRNTALGLLLRVMRPEHELASALQRVRVLTDAESVALYRRLKHEIVLLDGVVAAGGVAEDPAALAPAIEQFTVLLDTPAPRTNRQLVQHALLSAGAHLVVLNILGLPTRTVLSAGRHALLTAGYRFIERLCDGFIAAQNACSGYLSVMIRHVGANCGAAEALKAVYRNNYGLCSTAPPELFIRLVAAIAERGDGARFLQVLETLVEAKGEPVAQAQTMALKALMDRQRDGVLVLFNTDSGRTERSRLVSGGMKPDATETNVLNYHIRLVSLLAKCAAGNRRIARKCRALIPMGEALAHINDATVSANHSLQAAFLSFVSSVYCADLDSAATALPQELWELLRNGLRAVRAAAAESATAEFRAHVCDAWLPTLTAFLSHAFTTSSPSLDEQKTCVMLRDSLAMLNKHVSDDDAPPAMARNIKHLDRLLGLLSSGGPLRSVGAGSSTTESAEPAKSARKSLGLRFSNDGKAALARAAAQRRGSVDMSVFSDMDHSVNCALRDVVQHLHDAMYNTGRFRAELRQLLALFVLHSEDLLRCTVAAVGDLAVSEPASAVALVRMLLAFVLGARTPAQPALAPLGGGSDSGSDAGSTAASASAALKGGSRAMAAHGAGAVSLIVSLLPHVTETVLLELLWLARALFEVGGGPLATAFLECLRGTESEAFLQSFKLRYEIFLQRAKVNTGKLKPSEQEAMDPTFWEDVFWEEGTDAITDPRVLGVHSVFAWLGFIGVVGRAGPEFQAFLRSQDSRLQSVNVVRDLGAFMKGLSRFALRMPYLAVLLLRTMRNVCTGPHPDNQLELVRVGAALAALRVLLLPAGEAASALVVLSEQPEPTVLETYDGTLLPVSSPTELRLDVQWAAVLFLRELLDGGDVRVARRVAAAIDLAQLRVMVDAGMRQLNTASRQRDIIVGLLSICRQIAMLQPQCPLAALMEQPEMAEPLQAVGSIEILRDEQLSRIWYPVPFVCRFMERERKTAVLRELCIQEPKTKFANLCDNARKFEREMLHRKWLNKLAGFTVLSAAARFIFLAALAVAITINVLLVSYYVAAPVRPGVSVAVPIDPNIPYVLHALGIVHLALVLLWATEFFVHQGPIIAIDQWQWANSLRSKPAEARPRSPVLHILFTFLVVAIRARVIYVCAMVIFSFLGVFVSPFFFSVALLPVLDRSRLLPAVLSVTTNLRSLAVAGVLGLIAAYLFAVTQFVFLAGALVTRDGPILCTTLLQCLINQAYYSFRGGMAVMVRAPDYNSTGLIRQAIDFTFYVLISVFLFNMIFGVVIDTYRKLQQDNDKVNTALHKRCFICEIDRALFDRLPTGFSQHVARDHSAWNYLYFLVFLRSVAADGLTGMESYVAEMIAHKDFSFFPLQRSLELESQQQAHRPLEETEASRLLRLETLSTGMMKAVGQLSDRLAVLVRAAEKREQQATRPAVDA